MACALLWNSGARAASPLGVLVVAQSLDDLVSLDPAEGFELSSIQAFTSLYQRLVQPDPENPSILRPTLASGWQADPSGRSLTFELRSDAHFATGRPVRPEDVIFSLSRAVRLNRAPVFILNELGWTAANVDRNLLKLDARHVRISWTRTAGPAFALSILTAPVASIVDQTEVMAHDAAGDAGNAWLKNHSAGSGPFKLRRYIAHEALILDANPSSPTGAPLMKTLIVKNVADAATRRLLVEVGDADIARDLGPDQIDALRGKSELRIATYPSGKIDYLLFNTANPGNPALANPALWQAARWLVDYEGIANKLLKGEYEVHQAFLANGFPGALNETPYHLDVARAKAILASGGLANGARIKLLVFNQPPYGEIAQSLQATFSKAGIQLEIVPQLAAQLYGQIRARTEEAAWLYWIPDYFDANSTAGAFARNREDGTQTLAWRAGWNIPQLSEQTEAALAEPDPRARIERYETIQAEVQKNSPFVIALQGRTELVMRANVKGYRQGLNADMSYYDRVSK
jgi:peptide/nickel transport system substrate-binding protein